jgi:hypothetical protein
MSQLPPPPPGSYDIPPPPGGDIPAPGADFVNIPQPAPEAEQHEVDVLKRRKHFSWKKFGGEGFLVSVAFHLLLLIAGLFWVISKWKEPEKKVDETFATGAGGGANGDKAKAFEHKMQQRQPMIVKTPSRIVSKSANASVSLPSTPTTNTASFASGLSAGGMSKGSGGGSGGGEGTGIGIGKGGGKNFVSLFGQRGLNAPGLPGFFYDAKQTSDGKPTKYEPTAAGGEFADQVLRPLIKSWDPSRYEGRFFKAPDQLNASQIFIPDGSADGAPAAYGVGDKVKPSRWFAWYRGAVSAPKSGKFRFWGLGDDCLVVRWDKRLALDAGWAILSPAGSKGYSNHGAYDGKPVLGVNETKKGALTPPFRAGPWFDVIKGREYPIEIMISEIPGGRSGSWLMMEEGDSSGKPDGKLFLFRMSSEPLPPGIVQATGLDIDMTGRNLFWTAHGIKSGPVR